MIRPLYKYLAYASLVGAGFIIASSCSKSRRVSKPMALAAKNPSIPQIMGALQPQEVRIQVGKYQAGLQTCHSQSKLGPGLLAVEFTILGLNGKVENVIINRLESELKKSSFQKCIKREVKSFKFGKMTKGRNTFVKFPFRFPLK